MNHATHDGVKAKLVGWKVSKDSLKEGEDDLPSPRGVFSVKNSKHFMQSVSEASMSSGRCRRVRLVPLMFSAAAAATAAATTMKM